MKTTRAYSLLFCILVAAVLGVAYLAGLFLTGEIGFPLDDAWIHQTYARNLATSGQWAFIPGQVSAGSTAPLWSLMLCLGYLLRVPTFAWTFGLGILLLGLTGWTAAGLFHNLFPERAGLAWAAGLLCLAEWHMVWAAVSGMETVLFVWLALSLSRLWLGTPDGPSRRIWFLIGLVGAALILTRPEGVLLVGLVGLAAGWQRRRSWRALAEAWLPMAVGLALPLAPYLAWLVFTTGTAAPNTFFAKQQEYRALLTASPWWRRWLDVTWVSLVGPQALLAPGFLCAVGRVVYGGLSSRTRLGVAVLGSWWLLHISSYALRLPVTYQHGRYVMPAIPVFLLIGLWGTAEALALLRHPVLVRVLRRTLATTTGIVAVAFLVIGGRAYAADVRFIQGEMVATARWLCQNTPEDTLLAVHDIGAIGFFCDRPILDLAGLVTPEVIPFIDDELRLLNWMTSRSAEYVVMFPDWSDSYRRMAADSRLTPVFSTGFEWTLEQGRQNMTVFRLGGR